MRALVCAALFAAGCLDWNFSSDPDAGSPGPHDLSGADVKPSCPSHTVGFEPKIEYSVANTPTSLAVADLNDDGKPDIATANLGAGSATVLTSNKTGGYNAAHYPVGTAPTFVVLGELDGLNGPDLVTINSGSDNASVLVNGGTGAFMPGNPIVVGVHPLAAALGTIDNGTTIDLAITNQDSGDVRILVNNGVPAFSLVATHNVGMGANQVALGDLDGDGRLDLVVGNSMSGTIAVSRGNGDGSFGADTVLGLAGAPTGPGALALGDLDGDGYLDVAVTQAGNDVVSVFVNQGINDKGVLGPRSDYAVAGAPSGVAIGDVDGDGLPDLLIASSMDSQLRVLQAASPGKFVVPAVAFPVGFGPSQVATADFNGDGRLDVATANQISNGVSVLLNSCK